MTFEIPPRSGAAFTLRCGEILQIIDPKGGQVSDMVAFMADDPREALSNGRTFAYEETIRLTAGHRLWSNRSRPMLDIVEDSVGVHAFLLRSEERGVGKECVSWCRSRGGQDTY